MKNQTDPTNDPQLSPAAVEVVEGGPGILQAR